MRRMMTMRMREANPMNRAQGRMMSSSCLITIYLCKLPMFIVESANRSSVEFQLILPSNVHLIT